MHFRVAFAWKGLHHTPTGAMMARPECEFFFLFSTTLVCYYCFVTLIKQLLWLSFTGFSNLVEITTVLRLKLNQGLV